MGVGVGVYIEGGGRGGRRGSCRLWESFQPMPPGGAGVAVRKTHRRCQGAEGALHRGGLRREEEDLQLSTAGNFQLVSQRRRLTTSVKARGARRRLHTAKGGLKVEDEKHQNDVVLTLRKKQN